MGAKLSIGWTAKDVVLDAVVNMSIAGLQSIYTQQFPWKILYISYLKQEKSDATPYSNSHNSTCLISGTAIIQS